MSYVERTGKSLDRRTKGNVEQVHISNAGVLGFSGNNTSNVNRFVDTVGI